MAGTRDNQLAVTPLTVLTNLKQLHLSYANIQEEAPMAILKASIKSLEVITDYATWYQLVGYDDR